MREGYGPIARRYVARLPANLNVIAADIDGAAVALAAAADRKRAGNLFFAAPLLDDPRALVAQALAVPLLKQFVDPDRRRQVFDGLGDDAVWGSVYGSSVSIADESGEAIDARARRTLGLDNPVANVGLCLARLAAVLGVDPLEIPGVGEPERRALREFVLMGDAVLVRSQREAQRIAALLGRRRPFVATAAMEDTSVPERMMARDEAKVIVWAPWLDAGSLGVLAMALDHFKAQISYVCASGSIGEAHGDFVRPGSPEENSALASAWCIVDASLSDPGSGIALARLGVPLVAATTAGTGEYLDGVYEYDPWNWRTVLAAVSAAVGSVVPKEKDGIFPVEDLHNTLRRAAAPLLPLEPLVTIGVPTYNRPLLLARALDSLVAQTYKNIEVIVVNNGAAVDDVAARYPFVRVIENPQNRGAYAAIAQAQTAMNGKYFGWLGDDDFYFPDHIARLVFALEQTGASIAHSDSLSRFVTTSDGVELVIAHKVQFDRALDPFTILCGVTMCEGATLYRKSLFEEIGSYDLSIPDADLDFEIRLAQYHDFVHVDNVTFCWTQDATGKSFGQSEAAAESIRMVYDRYPSDSALVTRIRSANLRRFATRHPGMFWPPDITLPNGWQTEVHRQRAATRDAENGED